MHITCHRKKNRIRPDKKSETKWIEQFDEENLNWKTIYTTSLKATKDIKLQNFNYTFLMHSYVNESK